MKAFGDYNPLAVFAVFAAVTLVCMFAMDPWLLALAVLGAAALHFARGGRVGECAWYALFPLLMGLANPLFQHNGATVLFVLNDAPVTGEAAVYGLALGFAVMAVLWWSRAFSRIMTGDKLLYLFSAASPRLALILSMTLRYIPLFRRQAAKTDQAQRALGLYKGDNLPDTLRGKLRVFSVMVTWALENGVITADSMTARGYGVGRRSQFTLFLFRAGDGALLAVALLGSAAVLYALRCGAVGCVWYPRFATAPLTPLGLAAYILYGALCLLPAILELWEVMKWRSLRSAI